MLPHVGMHRAGMLDRCRGRGLLHLRALAARTQGQILLRLGAELLAAARIAEVIRLPLVLRASTFRVLRINVHPADGITCAGHSGIRAREVVRLVLGAHMRNLARQSRDQIGGK